MRLPHVLALSACVVGQDCVAGPDDTCVVGGYAIPSDADSVYRYKQELTAARAEVQKNSEHAQELFDAFRFNAALSRVLPLNRSIPDTRAPACEKLHYSAELTASVVLVYNNEDWSVLLRTAQSVIDRTPARLLHEIIFVDDGSDFDTEEMAKQVSRYAEDQPKVKLVKMPSHIGLMVAKVEGAKVATGDVLVFLDSHCEVNVGWLEPLLQRIESNPNTAAVPMIDSIDAQSFLYRSSPVATRGVFGFSLYYAGGAFSDEDSIALAKGGAAPLPAMPGGLFAIRRAYFDKIGMYDTGLRVWGGENIELSMKVWRCLNGRVELVACSRVGHIFRDKGHTFPHGEGLHKNYKRVARVWLDDYYKFFENSFPRAKRFKTGDISEPMKIRHSLECQSMDWFVKNVFPDMYIPRDIIAEGLLVSEQTNTCLTTGGVEIASHPGQHPSSASAVMWKINHESDYNYWYFTRQDGGRVVHLGVWIEECLGASRERGLLVCQCGIGPGSSCTAADVRWEPHEVDPTQIRHVASKQCLALDGKVPKLAVCSSAHRWRFAPHAE